MHSIPVVYDKTTFAATGTYSPQSFEGTLQPLKVIPMRWAIQVSGLNSSGVSAAATSWTVVVQPSLDGLSFNDMSTPMIQHVNTSNADGDVVFGGSNYYPVRFYKIHCSGLVLGGSAVKIQVVVIGVA